MMNSDAINAELAKLWGTAMDAFDKVTLTGVDLDPRSLSMMMGNPPRDGSLDPRLRKWRDLPIRPVRWRAPTVPLASANIDQVAFTTVEETPIISLVGEDRISDRPVFFNWDGNPEGYK
jgi:hypothetical protein